MLLMPTLEIRLTLFGVTSDPQVRVIGLSSDVDAARSIIHRELGVRVRRRSTSLPRDVTVLTSRYWY